MGACALTALLGSLSDAKAQSHRGGGGGFHGGYAGHGGFRGGYGGYGRGYGGYGRWGYGGWGYGGWGGVGFGLGFWPGYYAYPYYAPAYYPAYAYYPQPPAAPPATSQPARAASVPNDQRAYQVFFNFDRSDLTPAAAQVVQQAAQDAKNRGITRIYLTGHTDTTGTSSYNQALSDRRAARVKQALIEDGVAADDIVTTGAGKTGLLVPTGDQVREPQNRRVEIILGDGKTS
jgi:outer membrane protein OmpA-like peptidoglycan-associated protein